MVTVTVGSTYTLSAWGKLTSTGDNGKIGIKYMDSAWATIRDDFVSFTTTSYTQKSLITTVPSGTVNVEVYAYKTASSGYLYADDFSLTKN